MSSGSSAFGGDPNEGVFARGTSNTSDSMGFASGRNVTGGRGRMAMLHPNEAVIPLDGGGSVPVSLKTSGEDSAPSGAPAASFLDQAQREESRMRGKSQFSPGSTRSTGFASGPGGRGGVTIQMVVNTPDANSFLKNSDQITQELSAKLQRTENILGSNPVVDDPTHFIRKRDR